jgi:ubiquinone/menaquinone biosynthesis C-methylase UbiE
MDIKGRKRTYAAHLRPQYLKTEELNPDMTAARNEKGYWGQYALNYDEDAEYVVGTPLRRAIFAKLLEEQRLGKVIEFGCGTGFFTKALARNATHIYATDVSDEMLEVARRRLKDFKNVTVQKNDCENASFPPDSFDTAFLANVIHTIARPLRVLGESRRILREEGLLLITCYTDYGTMWFDKMNLGFRFFQKFGLPPLWYTNYSPAELASLVKYAGFAVAESLLITESRANSVYLKARKI